MNKLVLSFLLLSCSLLAAAQKRVVCKKGKVFVNDAATAQYDGKGGAFKLYHLGVFAPDSKDTIFSIHEYNFDPQNPLFDPVNGYKLSFNDDAKTTFDIKSPYNFRLVEKGLLPLIFNDSVPLLIQSGKLNDDSLKAFRKTKEYNHNKYLSFIKEVEDTLARVNRVILKRDFRKPILFTKTIDNSISNPHPELNEVNEVYEITQDNILLGKLQKKVTGGSFGKADYIFWKAITPLTVNGIALKSSPLAMVTIKAGEMFPVDLVIIAGKKTYKFRPGPYNQMDTPLINELVANGEL